MKNKERYWFENTLANKPVIGEEKIFNKYKGLVKYAITKIKRRFDQDDDLISVGNIALLKKIRYNEYCKNKSKKKIPNFRDFFMQVILGAMIRELNKQKQCKGSTQVSIADDFDSGEGCEETVGVILSNEDAIMSLKWRDEKTKKTVLKEMRPAIYGNPEDIFSNNELAKKIIDIVNTLPCKKKNALYDYFGLIDGNNMSYTELANKYNMKPPSARKMVLSGIEIVKNEYLRMCKDEI